MLKLSALLNYTYGSLFNPFVRHSDVARPLSYKTKTNYFFKTKTGQAKTKTKNTISRPRPFF